MSIIRNAVDSILPPSPVAKLLRKAPEDVVICWNKRSGMGKAKKGQYAALSSDELLVSFFKASIADMKIDPSIIGDICVGTVLSTPYVARAAALAAGFPESVPVQTINRFCSSGLMAVANIANAIRNGEIEVGLAVGFESMSSTPDRAPAAFGEELLSHQAAADCAQPMGWTSENVAKDFNISRARMDELAAISHQRAFTAQSTGDFDHEILPIETMKKGSTPNDTVRVKSLAIADDGIRGDSTKEGLAKIRSAFPQWSPGNTTGGNASQITDGVAGVLLMTRRKAEELGLPILAKHVCTSVAGLAPRIMGIGPSVAIPKVLTRAGLTKEDVDLWEVNEAFASMFAYCIDIFGLPAEKVNVNGGAIALGHPLGATGARQVATGVSALAKRGGGILVTSMCIGTGMGAASVFVVEARK